jgi:hypothetical protein
MTTAQIACQNRVADDENPISAELMSCEPIQLMRKSTNTSTFCKTKQSALSNPMPQQQREQRTRREIIYNAEARQ